MLYVTFFFDRGGLPKKRQAHSLPQITTLLAAEYLLPQNNILGRGYIYTYNFITLSHYTIFYHFPFVNQRLAVLRFQKKSITLHTFALIHVTLPKKQAVA